MFKVVAFLFLNKYGIMCIVRQTQEALTHTHTPTASAAATNMNQTVGSSPFIRNNITADAAFASLCSIFQLKNPSKIINTQLLYSVLNFIISIA